MKKQITLTAVLLLALSGTAQAQEKFITGTYYYACDATSKGSYITFKGDGTGTDRIGSLEKYKFEYTTDPAEKTITITYIGLGDDYEEYDFEGKSLKGSYSNGHIVMESKWTRGTLDYFINPDLETFDARAADCVSGKTYGNGNVSILLDTDGTIKSGGKFLGKYYVDAALKVIFLVYTKKAEKGIIRTWNQPHNSSDYYTYEEDGSAIYWEGDDDEGSVLPRENP